MWDTSQLNIGLLKVTTAPVISSTKISGGSLFFSGTGGRNNGSYLVLTTTNLAMPLASWTVSATNNFDRTGGFSVTNAIPPGTPQIFYRIELQ
jgi:hypothetical protein